MLFRLALKSENKNKRSILFKQISPGWRRFVPSACASVPALVLLHLELVLEIQIR